MVNGSTVTFTTDPEFIVSTGSISVSNTSATLNGSVDNLGGASSADVLFEYRKTSSSTWQTTPTQTVTGTGTVSDTVDGLDSGTEYEARLAGTASDGDSDSGAIASFLTESQDPTVQTNQPTMIDDTEATLSGTVVEMGDPNSLDVSFEYRPTGADTWSVSSVTTIQSAQDVTATVTGLSPNTEYEYRIIAVQSTSTDGGKTGETKTGSYGSTTYGA